LRVQEGVRSERSTGQGGLWEEREAERAEGEVPVSQGKSEVSWASGRARMGGKVVLLLPLVVEVEVEVGRLVDVAAPVRRGWKVR
jgi:hypothetical protein